MLYKPQHIKLIGDEDGAKKTVNSINVQEDHDGWENVGKLVGNEIGYRKVKIDVDQIQYHGREREIT